MIWYIAAAILFLITMVLLVWRFILDRRYLRKKTSEAMGPELRSAIQEEREESQRRQDAFKSALKDAKRPHDDTVS